MDNISILFFGMKENGSHDFIINEILPQSKEKKICWFACKSHLDKYLKRYNIKKKDVEIEIVK